MTDLGLSSVPLGISMRSKDSQNLKTPSPMVLTLLGIYMDFIALQPLKANRSIFLTLLGTETSVKAIQSS